MATVKLRDERETRRLQRQSANRQWQQTAVRQHSQGNYPTTTAKIKERREEIAVVGGSGASIDIDGQHLIVTGRTTVRRYGLRILFYGRSQR